MALDPALPRSAAQVLENLRLRREHPAPVGVQLERVRIEVSRHVAGAPRVRVRPPGATERLVALEHQEVVEAGLAQLDSYPEAAEPRADDRHAHIAQPAIRAVRLRPTHAYDHVPDDSPFPAARTPWVESGQAGVREAVPRCGRRCSARSRFAGAVKWPCTATLLPFASSAGRVFRDVDPPAEMMCV